MTISSRFAIVEFLLSNYDFALSNPEFALIFCNPQKLYDATLAVAMILLGFAGYAIEKYTTDK